MRQYTPPHIKAADATKWMAAKVKLLREELGISQLQLADEAGLRASVVHRAERGQDSRFSTWAKIFEGLGYYLEIRLVATCDEAEDLSREEAERRRERRLEGLCAGKWRFY